MEQFRLRFEEIDREPRKGDSWFVRDPTQSEFSPGRTRVTTSPERLTMCEFYFLRFVGNYIWDCTNLVYSKVASRMLIFTLPIECLSDLDLGIANFDGADRLSSSPVTSVYMTNLSKISIAEFENFDIDSLSKGLANIKILIRNRQHDFNHKDKIFDAKRPLKSEEYVVQSECQDCLVTLEGKNKVRKNW